MAGKHSGAGQLGQRPDNEAEKSMESTDKNDEKIPKMQQLLDNPFLLLFIGVMVPMVVYILWGVIDILTIPVAK